MDIGVISTRYAKALLAYATENGVEDKVYQEMLTFAKSFLEIPSLRQAIDNPILPLKEKISLVCNAAGTSVTEEYVRFVKLLFRERREKFFYFISLVFADLYRVKKNITVGRLTTALPVDEATEQRMKRMVRRVTLGPVEFETRIDPQIGGGFIFDVDTYRVDGSIATQFKRVKKQFIEKNKRIV